MQFQIQAIVLLSLFGVTKCSELKIVHPSWLSKEFHGKIYDEEVEGVITSSLGNYGEFNYGTTIRGRLHYPLQNQDGCREFTDEDFDNDHLQDAKMHKHHPIIMVDRGNCRFTEKSRHIMDYGGLMAIIVDNKENESAKSLVMRDDGTG